MSFRYLFSIFTYTPLYYYHVSCSCMTTVASATATAATRPAAIRGLMTPRNFFSFFFFFFHLVRFHLLGRIWVWFGLVWKMGREDHENIRMDLFPFAMRCD